MSFAASQARLMMLIAMQYDIELQTQFMLQHKYYLSKVVTSFMNMKAEYEPNSKHDRILEARIHRLNEAERILEVRLKSLENRSEAIKNERESLSKAILENTKRTFSNAYTSSQ